MTPEEEARVEIDAQLTASGWTVRTKDKINLAASSGGAVCQLSFGTKALFADFRNSYNPRIAVTVDRPSPAGAGEGGWKPGEGCRAKLINPLEKKPTVSFEKLLDAAALGHAPTL